MLLSINLITVLLIIISIFLGVLLAILLKNKKIKIVFNIVVYIIYALIIVVLLQRGIYKDNRIFNCYLYQISSGSMRNTLQVNDFILVKKEDTYQKGDIITYHLEEKTITHRIVSIEGESVITKGDANFHKDDPINQNQIIGKTIYHGKLLNFCVKYLSYILISFTTSYLVVSILSKTNKNKYIKKED